MKKMKVIRFFCSAILAICLVFLLQGSTSEEQGIVIVIDNSGSIGDKASGGRDIAVAESWLNDIKITSQKYYIGNKSLENVDMGLIQFGGTCEVEPLSELGESKDTIRNKLNTIRPRPDLDASSPIIESINRATYLLAGKDDPKIVIFTDLGENCTKTALKQCAMIKRIEGLIANRLVKLDLTLVGYKVIPELAPDKTGFPRFPGIDCIKNSELITFRYINGGGNLDSLDKAVRDIQPKSTTGSSPSITVQCILSFNCGGIINITIGGSGLLIAIFLLFLGRENILKLMRKTKNGILISLADALIAFGEGIKKLGRKIAGKKEPDSK